MRVAALAMAARAATAAAAAVRPTAALAAAMEQTALSAAGPMDAAQVQGKGRRPENSAKLMALYMPAAAEAAPQMMEALEVPAAAAKATLMVFPPTLALPILAAAEEGPATSTGAALAAAA